MKVIMDITGIDGKVIVPIPDTDEQGAAIQWQRASKMAIETVCMIKETDIDIIEII